MVYAYLTKDEVFRWRGMPYQLQIDVVNTCSAQLPREECLIVCDSILFLLSWSHNRRSPTINNPGCLGAVDQKAKPVSSMRDANTRRT